MWGRVRLQTSLWAFQHCPGSPARALIPGSPQVLCSVLPTQATHLHGLWRSPLLPEEADRFLKEGSPYQELELGGWQLGPPELCEGGFHLGLTGNPGFLMSWELEAEVGKVEWWSQRNGPKEEEGSWAAQSQASVGLSQTVAQSFTGSAIAKHQLCFYLRNTFNWLTLFHLNNCFKR